MTLRQEAYAMIDSLQDDDSLRFFIDMIRRFNDFEDCLQDECARRVNADCLVTCNMKDFRTAKTKVYSPDEFVSLLR